MVQLRDVFIALLLVGSTGSLEVQITPSHGEISVGESKFFLCEVVGAAKQIDWYGPTGNRIEPNRPDITVTRNDDSSSTLTLYKAGTDNAGTYKCVAATGDRQAESTINVKIYQKITFTNAPSPQEFNEGDNAILVCDVISSPPPTVFWKHKGIRIQVEKDVRFKVLSNHHLQIRGIKKTDEGSYTCEGRLMARGEIDLRVIKVVVNVLPTIRVWQSEVNATADVGQTATLTCAVDGYPEPTVTWTRNGVVLEAVDKYSFNEDGSEMNILDVAKLDEGEYTCIAKNKAGESDQELSLRVFVKPKITYIVNQTASEMAEQVTLTCEALGEPTPTIHWSYGVNLFTEGEQSPDGNVVVRSDARVSSLTVKKVKYTDAGQYLCTARSAIGEDAQPAHLDVLYAPKIQGAVAVYTWEGNAANISCEVQAHPSDVSILWLRDGLQLPGANATNAKVFKSPSASYLEVTPESDEDYGNYNCTASNDLGTESKEFLLIQADVPSVPALGAVEPFSTTVRVQFQEPEATGGVPVLRYRAEWRTQGRGGWAQQIYEVQDEGSLGEVTIKGLKPETSYEVKMSAINGKGEGEAGEAVPFKTKPVRKPNPPKLEGALQPNGNSVKINWIKQDDGGSPILHYLVRYRPKDTSDWKPEVRLPAGSEHAVLSELRWDTDYDVFVVAENLKGKSQAGTYSFRTAAESSAIPADLSDETLMSIPVGIIAGILVVIFLLLLLAVDVTCFFVNKCGLIMCLCGKEGAGSKGKSMEEGTAAFIKDESKEPIVEVRTEDECTANHNAAGPTEPNETTPLTEPELAAYAAALALDNLSSVATDSDTATATFDPAQDSPSSEATTLTCSLSMPAANDPSPTPVRAPAPTPESNTAPPTPLISNSAVAAKMVPLVEQGANDPPGRKAGPPSTPEQGVPQKSATPIPPKRRNSPKLASLNARGGLPVSSLASSSASPSPTLDSRKPAPSPPVARPSPRHTPVALDTETPVKTASIPANTAAAEPDPDAYGSSLDPRPSPLNSDAPAEQAVGCSAGDPALDDPTASASPAVVRDPPKAAGAKESASRMAELLSPVPAAAVSGPAPAPASSVEEPLTNDLAAAPAFHTYDLLTRHAAGPDAAAARVELELAARFESPALPPVDLISLDSPPSAPFLPNGDGARLLLAPVLQASETLTQAAPSPANDEKIICDERGKAVEEEAAFTGAPPTETTAEHNCITPTYSSSGKA